MKKLFLLILIFPSLILGQTKDELDLCVAFQSNNFATNISAEKALNKILNTIGASKNFVLAPCDKLIMQSQHFTKGKGTFFKIKSLWI